VIYLKKLLIIFLILLTLTSCFHSTVPTDSSKISYEKLSAKKEGWGFRRTAEGPEFTKEQTDKMNKYKCIYRENTKDKSIYLTFDEGYEKGYTPIILDVLRDKDVKAAFFVTGQYVRENPDLIKRMEKEGHIVGNHTLNHPSLPEIRDSQKLEKELSELDRLIYAVTGKATHFLRPPKGEYSEYTLAETKALGYTNVFWSQAYVDWNDDVTKETAFEKITSDLHPGCVLLLHAVSKGNADALGDVIDYARKEGYTFKNLNEYKN